MRNLYIIGLDGELQPTADIVTWSSWMATADHHVALDKIGDVTVSTVFLSIDHNFSGNGPPVLWETMIFAGSHDGYQERYTSRNDALAGHQRALDLVSQEFP